MLIGMLVVLAPIAALVGALVIASRFERARVRVVACQIALTDAIHRHLGAVAAPVVRRRPGDRWEVLIPLPLGDPATVADVLSVAGHALARVDCGGLRHARIVVTGRAA